MLEWLRGHGVDDVILVAAGSWPTACATCSATASALGIRLRYLEEPEPLGTGGALKFAEDLLDERFFMLNGDVLTDIDLTAQLEQHERTGAPRDAGADPGRGSVGVRAGAGCNADNSVREFVEKPGARADRHEPDQRRRLHPRARACSTGWRPPARTSRSSARCSRRSSAAACSATRRAATGSTSARPSATSRATYDILEGNVSDRDRPAARRRRAGARRRRDGRRPRGRAGAGRRRLRGRRRGRSSAAAPCSARA